jgi:hypothetical protein
MYDAHCQKSKVLLIWGHHICSRSHSQFSLFLIFPALPPKKSSGAREKKQIYVAVLQDAPPPPLPDAPSACNIVAETLDDAFDAILDPLLALLDDFSNEWCVADTEKALALSGIDNSQLNDCNVDASASVWGVPMMRLVQLEACFCILHPHHPNSLVVVHRMGGGKTHIHQTLSVIGQRIILIFIPLLTLSADVMHKFQSSNPT